MKKIFIAPIAGVTEREEELKKEAENGHTEQ